MGIFEFIPQQGSSYKLKVVHKGVQLVYDLPSALVHGVVMRISEHREMYKVDLRSSLAKGLRNFNFVGTQRTGVVFEANIAGNARDAFIKVPKSALEQGIVQFTLFDNNGNPLSERLSFYETGEADIDLKIKPSKEAYGTRELVQLEIRLDSTLQQKVQTNMSIAVTDRTAISPDPFGLDIKSQLLLNSELKGTIEQPGCYFNSDDPARKRNLDVLMMTQGWRKFIVNDSLDDSLKPFFYAETDLSLSGQVKSFYNPKKPAVAEVSITYNNSKEQAHETVITDGDGRFVFNYLDFPDSTSVIIQAKKIKDVKPGKRVKSPNMNFHIALDSFVAPTVTLKQRRSPKVFSKGEVSVPTKYLESLFQLHKETIVLEEVVVEADNISDKIKNYRKKRAPGLI